MKYNLEWNQPCILHIKTGDLWLYFLPTTRSYTQFNKRVLQEVISQCDQLLKPHLLPPLQTDKPHPLPLLKTHISVYTPICTRNGRLLIIMLKNSKLLTLWNIARVKSKAWFSPTYTNDMHTLHIKTTGMLFKYISKTSGSTFSNQLIHPITPSTNIRFCTAAFHINCKLNFSYSPRASFLLLITLSDPIIPTIKS